LRIQLLSESYEVVLLTGLFVKLLAMDYHEISNSMRNPTKHLRFLKDIMMYYKDAHFPDEPVFSVIQFSINFLSLYSTRASSQDRPTILDHFISDQQSAYYTHIVVYSICYRVSTIVNILFDAFCTVSEKNNTDVAHYNFNAHQPILIIFGTDVVERECYRMMI